MKLPINDTGCGVVEPMTNGGITTADTTDHETHTQNVTMTDDSSPPWHDRWCTEPVPDRDGGDRLRPDGTSLLVERNGT